jgi:tRNA-splicing ligase RtcB
VNLQGVRRDGECRWVIEPEGEMRVPAVLYADEVLLADMDDKVRRQLCNVASLPGIVGAACAPILTHLCREAFRRILPGSDGRLLYDVSHNICKEELHGQGAGERRLYVHRKGATRAFGPGHAAVPVALRGHGQPVLIGGSMGTASYVLAGCATGERHAWSSACHGAGRSISRHQATRQWHGRQLVDELAARGILIRSPSLRGVAEEAPGAYKSVERVVDVAERAGLARKVARLEPPVCVKG